ncbi:hypothetical protein GCM10009547_39710 [Sporichthya brevicatena]|uniref:Uncharacterized protein n=1 Tax=Sporichthya brevicatena TaxID=171442 RepID=A0ABN1H7N3_9ACTN
MLIERSSQFDLLPTWLKRCVTRCDVLQKRPCGGTLSHTGLTLREESRQVLRVERTRNPEGSRERPAAQGEGKTLGSWVQMRSTARQPAARIGDTCALDRHDPQQVGLGSPFPTPHARTEGNGRGIHAIDHRTV